MMEVPGKRQDPDLEKGSQGNAGEFCHPCGCDGKHVPAEGFCQTCDDYLCAECFKAHTIPRPMRNHVLLDKANMPRSALGTRKLKNTCSIICTSHHNKIIEFFCPAHNAVLCGVCAVVQHKQCNTVYIPDVAEEYKSSKEFQELLDSLNHLEADIKTLSSSIKESISSVKETSTKAIQDIRQFRKELNDYLDKKEQELVLATKKMEQDDTRLLQNLTDELDSLHHESSNYMKQLKSVDNEISDLFVTSKQLTERVKPVLDRFARCAKKNEDFCYTFEQDPTLTDLLTSLNFGFGKIMRTCDIDYYFKTINMQNEVRNIDFTSKTAVRMSDITVKTMEDTESPRITGMVLLSPHTLLLADKSNHSVKTVNTKSSTIQSRLSMSSYPWDIALLPQDQAAVTLPSEKKIQIISTKDRLSAVRYVIVDGPCFGISATKENLIVTLVYPKRVDILNFQGNVIVSVSTDSRGQALFEVPRYNTVVAEKGVPVIFVSDWSKDSIIQLSVGGQVLSTYTHKNWSGLNGMTATGDGQLLVCNCAKQSVDVISEGGRRIQTLLTSTQGINYPEPICYCADQNIIYVGSCSEKIVQAYKLT